MSEVRWPVVRRALATVVATGAVALGVPVAVSAPAEDNGGATAACEVAKLPNPKGYEHAWAHELSGSGEYIAGGAPGDDGEIPVLWRDGEATVIDELSSNSSGAAGVNDSGQMIGYRVVGDYTVPWLYHNGEVTDLNVPSGYSTFVADINNQGNIVGYVFDVNGEGFQRPIVWSSPTTDPVPLETESADTQGRAYAIDEDGTITGIQAGPDDTTPRLWVWGSDGGKGRELTRPVAKGTAMTTSIRSGQVVSRSGDGVASYRWSVADLKEGIKVELANAADINPHGTIVGSTKDYKPAVLTDEGIAELPGADGPAETPDENKAFAISDAGDVIAGTINDNVGKTSAALWTCPAGARVLGGVGGEQPCDDRGQRVPLGLG